MFIDHEYYDRQEEIRRYAEGEYLDSLTPQEYADYLRESGFSKEADEYLDRYYGESEAMTTQHDRNERIRYCQYKLALWVEENSYELSAGLDAIEQSERKYEFLRLLDRLKDARSDP